MWRPAQPALPLLLRRFSLVLVLIAGSFGANRLTADDLLPVPGEFERQLEELVALDPEDAGSWRLLGRMRAERGDLESAVIAFQHAVELSRLSPAAHFDLAEAESKLGRHAEAVAHYRQARELAPDSEYGQQAAEDLKDLIDDDEVRPANYQIRDFDGLEHTPEEAINAEEGWWQPLAKIRFQTGFLYNSNVALSSLSRGLAPGQLDSVQGTASPNVELQLVKWNGLRTGPRFAGQFTLNEGNFSKFNLQSYQSGWFVESKRPGDGFDIVTRVDYLFTHDEFAGRTFGNRHALISSASAVWKGERALSLFWAADYTNFALDGTMPGLTSRDGWTNSIGLIHEKVMGLRYWRLLRTVVQFERADTVGTNATFNSVGIAAEAWCPLWWDVEWRVRGGWGYRDYPEFRGTPKRADNVWTAGTELRKQFTPGLRGALVFGYNLFDSRNPLFTADRVLGGIVFTYEH